MTRRMAMGVAAALLMSFSVTVLAHMKLTKSLPAADAVVAGKPAKVQIWFTETPDKAVSKISVTGPSGEVKLGALAIDGKSMAAAIDGATPDGSYKVSWQAAGDDGHQQKGEYSFSVRQTR